MRENKKSRAKNIFLELKPCRNYNTKKFKILWKVAVDMGVGRPKAEIPRDEKLTLRFSKFELEKISRVAKQKNLTKTAAILRGIDLLELDKPKKYANIKELQRKRREEMIKKGIKIYDDDNDDD